MLLVSSVAPLVTFVVPCYKLAHFLGDCLRSILEQDYDDFEVIVMDDCSPDDTAAVAASFTDPRLRYVRNEPNLGHLRNYNRGIGLAKGRYLWLISADDRLRDRGSLGRLVAPLEATPGMSFAFSPGMMIATNGVDLTLQGHNGETARTHSGPEFFARCVQANHVCTPAVLVRTERYRQAGFFPLDLPFAGEWYLWLRFALLGPVGYVPQAGVDYRQHVGSNTAVYTASDAAIIVRDEVEVRWRIRQSLQGSDSASLLAVCDDAIATDYARRTYRLTVHQWQFGLGPAAVRDSIQTFAPDASAHRHVWSAYCESLGDLFLDNEDMLSARVWYRRALVAGPLRGSVSVKLALACTGRYGSVIRERLGRNRHTADRVYHDVASTQGHSGDPAPASE